MKETKFIEQNQEKWKEYETLLRQNSRDPQRLNELFIQITDDLSYARTYYPNRSVRIYLNTLAQRIFHNIYRGRRFPLSRLREFWTEELPHLVWQERRALQLALGLFILAFAIGVVSSRINPDFARVILSDAYIEKTLENIQKGDPMGVYKEDAPLGMSLGIAANNLFVALRTAIFGVLASLGTLFILLYNGIMIGAFQYFFIQQGLFVTSFLSIWIHGTLEVSAIIISGGAGLVAGKGFLFPGTYSRIQAFQITVRRGMKIFIGIVPMILMAAFFEAYVTRYSDSPPALRAVFIFVSLFLVLWYFVWLPWHKARRGAFKRSVQDKPVAPDRRTPINFKEIKTGGEVLSDAFTLLRRMSKKIWLGLAAVSVFYIALIASVSGNELEENLFLPNSWLGVYDGISRFFRWEGALYQYLLNLIIFAGLAISAFRAISYEVHEDKAAIRWTPLLGVLLLPMPIFFFLFTLQNSFLSWLLSVLGMPIIGLWCAIMYFETLNPLRALSRTFALLRLGPNLTLGFLLTSLILLLFLFLDSNIWMLVLHFFSWLSPPDEESMSRLMLAVTSISGLFLAYGGALLIFVAAGIHYFSLREIKDAAFLRKEMEKIGQSRQIRGLARE